MATRRTFLSALVGGPIVARAAAKCEYCGRYGDLGNCSSCGAANRPVHASAPPRVVTELFIADGRRSQIFTTKYPASDSMLDAWPNQLIIDGESYGPVMWGLGWHTAWDHANHRLVLDGNGLVPSAGQIVSVTYAAVGD